MAGTEFIENKIKNLIGISYIICFMLGLIFANSYKILDILEKGCQ